MNGFKLAINWLADILRSHQVPFQIGMGLAARVYGSKRDLYDIDIFIPNNSFKIIGSDIQRYCIEEPQRGRDEYWDLYLAVLKYGEIIIDLAGGTEFKIFDSNSQSWVDKRINFNNFTIRPLFGIKILIMDKPVLVDLKTTLARPVDIEDLKWIK